MIIMVSTTRMDPEHMARSIAVESPQITIQICLIILYPEFQSSRSCSAFRSQKPWNRFEQCELSLLSFCSEYWQCLLSSPLCLLNSLVLFVFFFLAEERTTMYIHGPSPLLCFPKRQTTDSILPASPLPKTSIPRLPFIFSLSQHVWLSAFTAT